jgi:exopolyphosphatase / guanosine-5'-triphosphate,3'-diphosphate pyrophosphatase
MQQACRAAGWDQAVGASGTIRAVQSVVETEGWSTEGITREALRRLRSALLKAGRSEHLRLRGLSSERRPVFAGGAMVLHGIFEGLDIDPYAGFRQRACARDCCTTCWAAFAMTTRATVQVGALQARYHVDAHPGGPGGATPPSICLLRCCDEWTLGYGTSCNGCSDGQHQLHEIGLDIAHGQYQKHGAYVVRNADMAGFSRQDQAATACLIRCHRRKIRHSQFADFPVSHRSKLLGLAVLLRLAVVLHRGRHAGALPAATLHVDGARLSVGLPAAWLEAHPLTVAELEEEAAGLRAVDLELQLDAVAT